MTSRSWISESYHCFLISRSLWVQQNHWRSINNYFFSCHFLNFLFNNWNIFKSLNSRNDKLLIRIWWHLHHHERFSISNIMIIISDQCLLNRLMILLATVIVVKLQVVISLTFIMILTQSSVDFIILWFFLNVTAYSWLII